jgi:hypothetical protein
MTTIITKFGVGAPTRNDLEIAELAVDATTGDLYTKLGDTSVVKVNGSSVYNDAGIKADLEAETQARVDGDAALQGQIDDLDLSGAIEEAPEDGKQYARQDAAWAEIQAAGGGNGNPVVISDNPPASPEEGDLWYSSKADDEGLYCWDGEVWFEAGGANGADGEDGQDGKQIWSETTPDGDIYYDKGNVSVSGSVRANQIGINNGGYQPSPITVQQTADKCYTGYYNSGGFFNLGATSDQVIFNYSSSGTRGLIFRNGDFNSGTDALRLEENNDATFSGTVNASEFITSQAVVDRGIYRPNANGCGIRLSNTNAIFPSDSTGTQSNGVVDLGGSGYQFKDGYFSGSVSIGDKNDDVDRKQILHLGASRPWSFVQNGAGAGQRLQLYAEVAGNKVFSIGGLDNPSEDVIEFFAQSGNIRAKGDITGNTLRGTRVVQDGSPVIDAKGLITTLTTLRNATKDETTLEGLRDSIGNAIGGLIEKYEAEIAVTMEVSE